MKTLLLALGFPPDIGGIETILYQTARRLRPPVIVVRPGRERRYSVDSQNGLEIHSLPSVKWNLLLKIIVVGLGRLMGPWASWSIQYLPTAYRLASKTSVSTIQCGHISLGFAAMCLSKLVRKPYLLWVFGQEVLPERARGLRSLTRLITREVIRNAHAIVVSSSYLHDKTRLWGCDAERITILPIGPDPDVFSPGRPVDEILTKNNLVGKQVILTIGRLVPKKAQDDVIKAMPEVLCHVPNAVYLVVGDGPQRSHLESLATELKLEDCVRFVGPVEHHRTVDFYRACDAFVMPSREMPDGSVESLGVVFLEAASCGKPAIGGRSGGIGDAIVDGVTGILVEPGSVSGLASAIVKILTDGDYAHQLGAAGRKRVVEQMNWERTAETIETVLDNMVDRQN